MLYDDFIEHCKIYKPQNLNDFLKFKPFSLDKSLVDSIIDKFAKDEKFCSYLKDTAVPPYKETWIEFKFNGQKIGCAVKGEKHYEGILLLFYCEEADESITCEIKRNEIFYDKFLKSYAKILTKPERMTTDKAFSIVAPLIGLVTTALGVMSSKRIICQVEVTPSTKRLSPKKDIKKLHSYSLIKIRPEIERAFAEDADLEKEQRGGRKLHWRRGHFKHCRTGTFWWSAHLAGSAANGVVKSRYIAEA